MTPGKLFWAKVERGDASVCWPWKFNRQANGYGRCYGEPGVYHAHRMAWLIAGRKLIKGMVIMHTCDNPPCCNPAHLRQVMQRDNMQDAWDKGRASGLAAANARRKLLRELAAVLILAMEAEP